MAAKTANVTARIQPDIKAQAESILERLGIPVSVFIDMTYRQVIAKKGVPFTVDISDKILTRDMMTAEEFNACMSRGLMQARADDSESAEAFFEEFGKRFE